MSDPLLRAILEDPADDAPRLVFADWLDERGQGGRAEFVRVQCELARRPADDIAVCNDVCKPPRFEGCPCRVQKVRELELFTAHGTSWFNSLGITFPGTVKVPVGTGFAIRQVGGGSITLTWSRGFVHSIALPTATMFGGPCPGCDGTGRHLTYPAVTCLRCHGSGRTPGCAAAIFAAHPVVRCVLTDKRPAPAVNDPTRFAWFREGGLQESFDRNSVLPNELLRHFAGPDEHPFRTPWYNSLDAALDALSAAAVAHGRRLAGLPPLGAAKLEAVT